METHLKPTIEETLKIFGSYMPISTVVHTGFFVTNPKPMSTTEYKIGHVVNNPTVNYWHSHAENLSLQVKPLERISDEDKKAIMEIELQKTESSAISCIFLKTWDECGVEDHEDEYVNKTPFCMQSFQYMQSQGYALPFYKWSVEELVEFGIYKITE